MKKIMFLLLIFIFIYINNIDEYNISEDEIRFRVIANSNSSRDILMKEKVVSELSSILFIDTNNKDTIRDNIYKNLENIETKVNKIFKENNYDKNFNIVYGMNSFPDKEFMGKKYKKGEYESLVIEIGDAKGNNYFCILYPSLCMIDYQNNKEEKTEIKFKIIDVFKKLF